MASIACGPAGLRLLSTPSIPARSDTGRRGSFGAGRSGQQGRRLLAVQQDDQTEADEDRGQQEVTPAGEGLGDERSGGQQSAAVPGSAGNSSESRPAPRAPATGTARMPAKPKQWPR